MHWVLKLPKKNFFHKNFKLPLSSHRNYESEIEMVLDFSDDFDKDGTLVRFSLSGGACRHKAASGSGAKSRKLPAQPLIRNQNNQEIQKSQNTRKIPKYTKIP